MSQTSLSGEFMGTNHRAVVLSQRSACLLIWERGNEQGKAYLPGAIEINI